MIIGNNNNLNNKNSFRVPGENRYGAEQNNNKQNKPMQTMNQSFVKDIKEQAHVNIMNKNDMSDKTLAMLHERYVNGTITLDEFNKQCNILGQKRQKQ